MRKFDLKSIFMGLVAGILVTGGVSVASSLVAGDVYFSSYPIYLNGSYYAPTTPVLSYNGRTYLPLNELGTILGSTVTFNNNAIYISTYNNGYNNSYNNGYNNNYNIPCYNCGGNCGSLCYYSNSYSKTYEEDIDITKGESEKYYISLARYGAKSATITGENSYVKVSKTKFTSSGDLKITGSKEGSATIKITYNTGDVEKLYVEVEEDDDRYEDDEISMDVGDTHKIYIDLDYYDADEAKITYDSDYVKVSKTTFTSDGYLTITAKAEGDTTVKIKYDSGDTEYIDIDIDDDDNDDYDEITIEEDDYEYIYIDLDEYDASKATLTYNSTYLKLDKTSLTSNGKVKVTARKVGYTSIKIKFDTGDIRYIDVEID